MHYIHRMFPPPPDFASARRAARLRATRERRTIFILQSGQRVLCVPEADRLLFYPFLPLVEKIEPGASDV